MKYDYAWEWEKHNILQYIIENEIDIFTVEYLLKHKTRKQGYYCHYAYSMWSDRCFELLSDKKLTVSYLSEKNRTVALFKIKK